MGEFVFVPLTPEDELRLKNDAVETMLNGFDIVDENGLFVYANPAYLAMWGYDSLDEIVGTSPANHCAEPDTPVHIMRTLQEHGQGGFEFLARRKDGSTFEVYMACRLFRDSKGRKFFTGISTDMTERNKLLSQYRQAQKMEAIGRLVGGVVHDFNNILQVIYSSAQLMEENSHNPSVTARETERVLSAVERATALTKQLLLTSRRQPLNDGPLDLPRAITDVAHMFERLLGDHIQVEWDAPSEALKLFRQHGSKIDLAVLDILMPDLNGTDVLKEIRKQNSDLPAFFCSGYNDSRLEDQNDLIRRTPILQKPYSVKDLIAMMRKAISV